MKTSTLRLARRLASVVDIRDAQQALVEDAFGVGEWGELFYADAVVSLRDLALKRRERARASGDGKRSARSRACDRLADLRVPHGPDHPVAATVDVGDLAVCLMLLPGLVDVGARTLVAALGTVQPIVAVSGQIGGFEQHLAGLLNSMFQSDKRKLIVQPITAPVELTNNRSARAGEVVMLHIRSSAMKDAQASDVRICLSKATRARMPIVVTREDTSFAWPLRMASAADLVIDAAPLDWPMLAELIDARTGIHADTVLAAAAGHAIDLAKLSLDDLALAIRSGRKLETILSTLADLAAAPPERSSDGEEDGASTSWTGKSSRRNRNGTAGTGSVRIDPQPVPSAAAANSEAEIARDGSATQAKEVADVVMSETGGDGTVNVAPDESEAPASRRPEQARTPTPDIADGKAAPPASGVNTVRSMPPRARPAPVVSVETLAGYGKARDWALDLKTDLVAWHVGTVPWSDLSSRLLLSGPPGTGKTTFARALGNTLQLPVFATSVATWLEASHLGDVLRRMRDCFEEAGRSTPCILFIDEIDGIGRRQDQNREYADYWNSIVNKMLELMDGTIRSEGIIVVGATNRPDDIEPALRRSGRLETHIVVPKPDMKALESILAFHLGVDLADILASAPEANAERERQTLRFLARAASSLTGADIERIVREERQRCRRASTAMALDPLRAALREGRTDLPADMRRQIAIHEAGHAVAMRALGLGTQGEMTIDAAEGGVSSSIIDMARVQSEDRLMDMMAMKLAGRAAETVCGLAPLAGSGTGPGSDLQVATHLALELECRAGFSADAPLLHVEPANSNAIHLARPDAYRCANARLERAFETARHLIEAHRDAHGALAEALLLHGTLDGHEADAILKVRMKRTE